MTLKVQVELIDPNPNNPRKNFDQAGLEELAQSIRENGIIQPLIVTFDETNGRYRLIAGERRWRAAQLAKQVTVPVLVRHTQITPEQEAELMLIENLQREDLNPIEEAQALRELLDNHDYTQEELAGKLGVSQSHIANRIRLLRLPDGIQESISRKIISGGHGLALLKLEKAPELTKEALAEVIKYGKPVADMPKFVDMKIRQWGKQLYGNSYGSPKFDHQEACIKTKCQCRVHAKDWDGTEHPYCINPKCWEEKQATAEEEEKQRRLAMMEIEARERLLEQGLEPEQIEKQAEEVSRPVDYSKLRHDDYANLGFGVKFGIKDCQGCAHQRLGQYGSGGQLTEICLDKRCFDKKNRAAQTAENKGLRENKREFEAIKERAIDRFCDGSDHKTVVFMVARVLYDPPWSSDWNKGKLRQAFYKKQGWPEKEASEEEQKLLERLEGLDHYDLLECLLWLLAKPSDPGNTLVQWWLEGLDEQLDEEEGGVDRELTEEEEYDDRTLHPNVSWILHCSCDDLNYKNSISQLTDEELAYCIKNERRTSGWRQLVAEAKRRDALQVAG